LVFSLGLDKKPVKTGKYCAILGEFMFWEGIEYLHRWEREHLPGEDAPQGREVLVWLLKSQNEPRPLKDLYRSSRFSEPTVRACLKIFIERGFVVESSGLDRRTRVARATPKLDARVKAYQERFQEVAAGSIPTSSLAALPKPAEMLALVRSRFGAPSVRRETWFERNVN
jgi:hypothetical protein